MNHIHRLVWNTATSTWVAVAENARGRGKGSSRKLVAAALSLTLAAGLAQAAPAGGAVTYGTGTISQAGAVTTIQQATPNLSLNWNSFNVGKTETVNFVQPSASAVAVNRIFDTNGSQILGRLSANGQVYLINPNGILFGQGAVVNVGGLVASTLGVSDSALTGSTRTFSGKGTGAVINQGSLSASEGGYLALLGNTVSNTGTLNAPQGTVALGGASSATLTFANNHLVSMQIDQSTLNTLVENGGLIKADGGMVVLNAGAKDSLLASVVNNTGIIQARTIENRNGVITLLGGMAAGTVHAGGTLDASAPNGGDGGFIETSAAHIKIDDVASITTTAANGKTGTWLIDPADFTISTTGGGTVTGGTPSGDLSNTTLQTALGSSNVTILSSQGSTVAGLGDINVNADVAWGANTLTLTAAHSINVNAVMSASGTSKLVMNTSTTNGGDAAVAGGAVNMGFNDDGSFKGKANFDRAGTGFLKINGLDYTVLNSLGAQGSTSLMDLQGMSGHASANVHFALGDNINASDTSGWNAGAGFAPIGAIGTLFVGTFNGLGHTISNLTVNRPTATHQALFGATGGPAQVTNVGLVNTGVTGSSSVGALAGSNVGTVTNSFSSGTVNGTSSVGGLMGSNTGTVNHSYSTSKVTASSSSVGGLMGSNTGLVDSVYATGNVSGTTIVGGLMGSTTTAGVTNSYATGNVTGTSSDVGGLMGSSVSIVSNVYATGNVIGTTGVGGLIGTSSNTVTDAYALGSATGTGGVGGLIGTSSGAVSNTYAAGQVMSSGVKGALVGTSSAALTTSYWNENLSGNVTSVGTGTPTGTLLTDAQMVTGTSFTGFDLTTIWTTNPNGGYPILRNLVKYATVTANDVLKRYDGIAFSGGNGVTYSGAFAGTTFGTPSYTGDSQGAAAAGTYSIKPFVTSNNQQLVLSFVDGKLVIKQGILSVSLDGSRPYDGSNTVAAGIFTLKGLATGETLMLTGSGTVADKNVGIDKPVTLSSLALGDGTGGLAANYTFVGGTAKATITRLSSVNWTGGGATNSWFDVGNWANGAIPDLSNVAGVIIPTGTLVGFNNTSGSAVNVNTVSAPTGTGPSLDFAGGTLSVGSSMQVASLNQTGGTLSGAGNVVISEAFAQSGTASIALTGDLRVSQAAGDLSVSNISGKNITLISKQNIDMGTVAATGILTLEYGQGAIAAGNPATYNVTAPVTLTQGDNFKTVLGYDGATTVYTVITTLGNVADGTTSPSQTTLQGMADINNLSRNFVLGAEIAAGPTSGWAGKFKPVGLGSTFLGAFDGLGHTITGLTIDQGATANIGLFASTAGSNNSIQNVGLRGGSIAGGAQTGSLVGNMGTGSVLNSFSEGMTIIGAAHTGGLIGATIGFVGNSHSTSTVSGGASGAYIGGLIGSVFQSGSVDGSYATGSVTGQAGSGGLIGDIETGTISNSYATGNVIGAAGAGGLVATSTGPITDSYATGNVTGAAGVGGLVAATTGPISNSFAIGHVIGNAGTGGLVGTSTSSISNSFAIGNVEGYTAGTSGTGAAGVGGLVGTTTGAVSISYASGSVFGGSDVGGLVGVTTSTISNTYAKGAVSGGSTVGGLVGSTNKAVSNSYASGAVSGGGATMGALAGSATSAISNNFYDKDVNSTMSGVGYGVTAGFTGMTTANMKTQSNFVSAGWDFTNIWGMIANETPILTPLQMALSVTANDATKVYDGTVYTGGLTYHYSITPLVVPVGTVSYNFDPLGGRNAGTYTITPGGLLDSQLYKVTFTNVGTLIITKAPLTISAVTDSKTYDGAVTSNLIGSASGLKTGDTLVIGQSFDSKNVLGANNSLLNVNYTLTDGNGGGNYDVTTVTATGTIGKAALTLSGSRAYDATKVVAGSILTAKGVGTEAFTVSGTGDTSNLGSANASSTAQALATLTGLSLDTGNTDTTLASNYSDLSTTGSQITIGKAALTLSGSRAYDGSTTMAGSALTATGINGEAFTVTGTGTANLSSKNVQNNQLLANVTNLTLSSGNTAAAVTGNYNALSTVNSQVSITPKLVTLTAPTITKVYDGVLTYSTQAADLSSLSTQLGVTGDSVSAATLAYLDKNVASNKTVTLSGVTLVDGNATPGANYTLTLAGNSSSSITPAAVSGIISMTGSRIYDGTADVAASIFTLSGLAIGENLTLGGVGLLLDKNVGVNKAVSLGTLALSNGIGANAGTASNYTFTGGTRTATITQAALAINAAADAKTYDGALNSNKDVTFSGLVGGDAVTSATQVFASKNVLGTGASTLQVNSGYTVNDGNTTPGGNYTVTTNSAAGTITAKAVTLTAPAVTKTYDGGLTYTTQATDLSALSTQLGVSSDTVSAATLAYLDKNVASNKTVTLSGVTLVDGNATPGANYALTLAGNSSSSITQAALAINAATDAKTYDGALTSNKTVTFSGLVGGDTVTGATQAFASKNVLGTGASTLQVNVGYTVSDGNTTPGGNYLVSTNSAVGSITAKALTATVTAPDKTYDGNTLATPTMFINPEDFVIGETVAATASATFNASDVQSANLVTVNSIALVNGNNGLASNYSLPAGQTVVAHITAGQTVPPIIIPPVVIPPVVAPPVVIPSNLLTTLASNTISKLQSESYASPLNAQADEVCPSTTISVVNVASQNSTGKSSSGGLKCAAGNSAANGQKIDSFNTVLQIVDSGISTSSKQTKLEN